MKEKNKQEYVVLWILFFVSVIVHVLIAYEPYKKICYYPDEIRYFDIARCIASGEPFKMLGVSISYQKIAYCFLIAPAFLFDDMVITQNVILVINAVLLSLGMFPLYGIARRLLKSTVYRFLTVAFYLMSAEFVFVVPCMAEALFTPLALFVFFLFLILQQEEGNHYVLSVFTGLTIYLAYLTKEIALAFPLGFIGWKFLTCFLRLAQRLPLQKVLIKRDVVRIAYMLLGFAIPFLLLKTTIFSGMGNFYDYQTGSLETFADGEHILYLLYGFGYCLCNVLISTLFLPIVFPAIFYRHMEKRAKDYGLLMLCILFVTAAVISYTVTSWEDYLNPVPRAHMRYVSYLFYVFIVLLFHLWEQKEEIKLRAWHWLVAGAVGMIFFVVYKGLASHGSMCDQNFMWYLSGRSERSILIFRVAVVLALLISLYLYCRKKRLLVWMWSIVCAAVFMYNTYVGLDIQKTDHRTSKELYEDCMELAGIMKQYGHRNFLILHGGHFGELWTYNADKNVYFAGWNITSCENGIDLSKNEKIPALNPIGFLPPSEKDVICPASVTYVCVPYEYEWDSVSQKPALIKQMEHLELCVYEVQRDTYIPALRTREEKP